MSAKVSYRAEGSIRGLWVNVNQSADGKTRIGIYWATRERGDEYLQGHAWQWSEEYPKRIKNLAHALSLAAWVMRKAERGEWTQKR